jgi:hypothetical protein
VEVTRPQAAKVTLVMLLGVLKSAFTVATGKECGRIAAEPSNDPNETQRHQPTELSSPCLKGILATCDRLTRSAGLSYSCGLDPCRFCFIQRERIWIETEHAIVVADAYPVAGLTWLQGYEMVRLDAAWRGLRASQG